MDFGILTIKIRGGIWNLTGTNNRSIGDSKILAGEVDLNVGEQLDALKLMLLVSDLAAKNSGLLYMLLLNNGLEMTPLLIDDLADINW